MEITDVKSSIYTVSLDKLGDIVQGIDFINQNIKIVLLTRKGEDPTRPEFGCDMAGKIDLPINQVRSSTIKSVRDAINTFIPEIVINKIDPTFTVGGILIKITWSFASDTLIKEFQTVTVNYYKQAA